MSILTFHGEDVTPSSPDHALFHIIPVPLEKTVSYEAGTSRAPAAIIEASCQLELFDTKSVPADYGLYTAPALDCSPAITAVLSALEERITQVLHYGAIPVTLGGEHSLSHGCIKGLLHHHDDFGVIQFDAHADLRDSYNSSKQSHASVMRRVFEERRPIVQIGTRSYSLEEHQFRKQNSIHYFDAEMIWKHGAKAVELPPDFPEKVYITFDVDCFDISLMPATGTPVPGGIDWFQAAEILQDIFEDRICVGFDIVELTPQQNMHGASFAAAQLAYNMMGYLVRSAKNRAFHSLDK